MSNSTYSKRDPYFSNPQICRPPFGNHSTPEGKSRMLTPNESNAAEFLFSIAIDTWKVRVYNGKLGFLQDGNVAITPRGHIYFPPKHFKKDYICENIGSHTGMIYERWFIHELVHAWQYQRGMHVPVRGLVSWLVSYEYELDVHKTLKDYGMEAQANLITDYYLLKKYNNSQFLLDDKYRGKPVDELRTIYETILLKNSTFPFVGWSM